MLKKFKICVREIERRTDMNSVQRDRQSETRTDWLDCLFFQ